jgi:RNA polymerase sigma-70 factor (ECF subfamily)
LDDRATDPPASTNGAIRNGSRLRITNEASNAEDLTLLAHVSQKDQQALEALYNKYQRLVYSLVLRIVRDEDEASELLQDVFVQVWQKADLFDQDRGNFNTWLLTLAHNKAINTLRSKAFKKRTLETRGDTDEILQWAGEAATDARTPLTEQIADDTRQQVLASLKMIPDAQREALTLAYYEGLSQSEIAEKLGVPLGTVKTRMRQGMLKLKELLGDSI